MKRIYKKLITGLFSLVVVVSCCFAVIGCSCDKDDNSKVMNLSLNPSIELVLDKENKVVSVNALNDEGNFIVASVNFKGLSAEEAVEEFLEATDENGFIVEGNVSANANELKISISGENAEKLFNKVKESAKDYLNDVNLNVNVTLDKKLTKEYLEAVVADCMKELSSEEIEAMSEEELINLIKASREETKELLSQELKELYYQARAEEILKAKFEQVSQVLANNAILASTVKPAFDQAYNTLLTSIDTFRAKYIEKFLSEESEYQVKMQEYIEAKNALLEARVNEVNQGIDTITQEVESTKLALENAKATANQALTAINNTINTTIATLEATLDTILQYLNQDAINEAVTTTKNNFSQSFKTTYENYINNNYWNDLKPTETN